MYLYACLMNTPLTPEAFLEQILQIPSMEHGSLSVVGQGPKGPYYNLNSWENGKNQCRYLPQDKVSQVQQAIEGYHKYQQITEQYAQQIIEQTRAELNIGVKKRTSPIPADPAANPPRPGSGNPALDDALPGGRTQRRGRSTIGGAGAHGHFPLGQSSDRSTGRELHARTGTLDLPGRSR